MLLIVYLANVKNVSKSVIESLTSCCNTIIPALFPTLIISNILLGINKKLKGETSGIFKILGNCKIYAMHIITGMLCGYIVGPKAICEDYKTNRTEESVLTLSAFLSSNAGISFVVGTVGISIGSSLNYGIYLYFSQVISAFIVFFLFRPKNKTYYKEVNLENTKNLFIIILEAVMSAINSILIICSFSIFVNAFVSIIMMNLKLNGVYEACILSIMDFSTAVFKIITLKSKLLKLFLTGFTVGFAGISVHLQTFVVCKGFPLNKLKFVIMKLLQGLICGIFLSLYALI